MLHNLPNKEVPKELIISSKSIRLLDAIGQGTLTCVMLQLNSVITQVGGTTKLPARNCDANLYNETMIDNEEALTFTLHSKQLGAG